MSTAARGVNRARAAAARSLGTVVAACVAVGAGAGCVATRLATLPPDAIVVDARTRTEYTMGHLACAKSLPWYEADDSAAAAALGSKTRPVVVYCLSGHRSATAKARLEAQGFTDVHDGGSMDRLRRLAGSTRPGSACGVFR
jgi:rhodanese-related sulfurtransferase